MTDKLFMRCVPMRWYEVRDVAIAIVHMFMAIRGEPCPICTGQDFLL